MGKEAWDRIKDSKFFYISTYRKASSALIFSLSLNILLMLAIYYLKTHQPLPDFYATNGITPPVLLSPMAQANYSDTALLPPDPVDEQVIKPIPE